MATLFKTTYYHFFISIFKTAFIIGLSLWIGISITGFTKTTVHSSTAYPTNDFISPTKAELRLSGTFGELRSNHFHAGIDIKGYTGQPLYTIGDGYVYRVKIRGNGYGNAVYIKHPNGYTSVYAHLHKLMPSLAAYIKKQQYSQQKFEVDLYFKAGQFAVTQGQQIGEMGTSGYSFGPHLHFEIRESQTERPINPLLFDLKVADQRAPNMHQLKIYHLNDQLETINNEVWKVSGSSGRYHIDKDTLMISAWRIGLGLKVYDLHDKTTNWNGIYQLDVLKDDIPIYQFKAEKFAFDETRYINAHLDYEEQVTKKSYFNRCYKLPGNRLSMYNELSNEGVVPLFKDKATKITMIAADIVGNTSRLEFWVKRTKVGTPPSKVYNYYLPYNEESIIENSSAYIHLPKGTLYENLHLSYKTTSESTHNIYSSVHQIHEHTTPVHQYYRVAIRPTTLPKDLLNKAFIAYCDKDNEVTNCGGEWRNGMLSARVRDFGDYCIMIDTEKPSIRPIRFQSDMRQAKKMSFEIKDNIETAGNVKGLTYKATIDGKWILFEYDMKNDKIIHYFDEKISAGEHVLKLEVKDALGNTTHYERTFRK